jgi:hypothetical protein
LSFVDGAIFNIMACEYRRVEHYFEKDFIVALMLRVFLNGFDTLECESFLIEISVSKPTNLS